MKDIIWLSPSLAGGAIAARLVAFFERRLRLTRARSGRKEGRSEDCEQHGPRRAPRVA
jgi:hypothetical protein